MQVVEDSIVAPQFDKLWQILDDCIKTGKYKQIRRKFSDDKDGRCINGVFLQYCLPYQSLKQYTKDFMYLYLQEIFNKGLAKYNYSTTPDDRCDELFLLQKHGTREDFIREMKKDFAKSGHIYDFYLVYLNNNGMSFSEIRDLLKEMDV